MLIGKENSRVHHRGKASIVATTEDGPGRLRTISPLAAVLAAAAIFLVAPASDALAAGAPVVLSTYSERVETNQANLKAQVDSNEAATTYFFEYTSEASYEQNEFAGASRVPATGEIPLAIKSQNASQHVDGLAPASAYRFRVVAKNEFGPTLGPPRLLTTDERAPKFSLPDSRGWELVSPAEKNGGQVDDPEADYGGGAFQAAAQGGGVTYSSLDSFAGGLGSPGASQYLSLRGEGGWTTAEPHRAAVLRRLRHLAGRGHSLPALLRRPRRRPPDQRPPLPWRRQRLPGRQPAAARLGSAGGIPELLPARQRNRGVPGSARERRRGGAETGARQVRSQLRRRDARPRSGRPLDLRGAHR